MASFDGYRPLSHKQCEIGRWLHGTLTVVGLSCKACRDCDYSLSSFGSMRKFS